MRKKEKEKIEEELDKATLHVIKQTTLEITNVKNKLMQERHNAEAEKRNRIQQHLASIMRAEENNEEERLKNDLAKAEQRYKEKQKLESDRRARMAKEKNDNFAEYERNIEEKEEAEKDIRKREMMKRLRMNEHDKVEMKKRIEMNREKKRLQRKDLDMQVEEIKFYTREARMADEEAVQRSALLWKMNDQEVLKYGDKVLRDCENKERPTLPVVKALDNFKKTNRLKAPRPKNLSQWKSDVMPTPFSVQLYK
uniref:Trichohyalin-plectin-homology domain-containing protein n=2 Tax=Cacopsylla melanoneura TaxID=428564 RepID=A0A8D8YKJ9_9HEMI